MITEIILTSLLVMSGSLIGVIAVWKGIGKIIERNLHFLVSFAAGVFIVLVYSLSGEVLSEATSVQAGLFWMLLGLVVVTVVVKLLPETHHHHDDAIETTPHTKLDARRMLIGDSLHNIGDGILMAVAFTISVPFGIAAAVSLFFHELVQEISEFFVLKQAGYSSKKALSINFATASTILIGSIGGYYFLGTFEYLEVPVLGLATGALLALLIQDLIPHSVHTIREQKCATKHIVALVIGAVAMLGVLNLSSDTHVHSGPTSEHEDHTEEEYHGDHDH